MIHIQNADVNVSAKAYEHLASDQLLIASRPDGTPSIFYTIQGEGPFAGEPAIFVRLAGCNRGVKLAMGCEFCDTAFQFARGLTMGFAQITAVMEDSLKRTRNLSSSFVLVVITGGEPMLQRNLVGFIEHLAMVGFPQVQIESNGDYLLSEFHFSSPATTLVVSPKATSKGYPELKPEVLKRADALKFIISADETSTYSYVPAYVGPFMQRGRLVYVQPMTVYKADAPPGAFSIWNSEAIDYPATVANYRKVYGMATAWGFRVSTQLHLFYGAE